MPAVGYLVSIGKKPKKVRAPSGRGKLKISMGKIPKSKTSGKGLVQRRKRGQAPKQERDGPPILAIVAGVAVLLVLLFGALALLSK